MGGGQHNFCCLFCSSLHISLIYFLLVCFCFQIKIGDEVWSVFRRFSKFRELHQTMQKKYPNVSLHSVANTLFKHRGGRRECKYFPLHASFGCSVSVYTKACFFFFFSQFYPLRAQPWRAEEGFHVMYLTLCLHMLGLFMSLLAQTAGGTKQAAHKVMFWGLTKRPFLTNRIRNWVRKCCVCI